MASRKSKSPSNRVVLDVERGYRPETVNDIRVLVVGDREFKLPFLQVERVADTADLFGAIARFRPDVIVTTGAMPSRLQRASFEIRKRWVHVSWEAPDEQVVEAVRGAYRAAIWDPHPMDDGNFSLVSVYTATYNTGDYLWETYESLRDQTYPTWEWVVVDDCSTDDTWERLQLLAKQDVRVRPLRLGYHSGKIGDVKDMATRLARGSIFVELDHDDRLTDNALRVLVDTFLSDESIGMVYSNCSSFFEDGSFQRFDDNFWRDRYRTTQYRGREWLECLIPDIYGRFGPAASQQFGWFLTVGPHHVRAFRAPTFWELGGYNPNLPVVDDWDLFARFFLGSRCVHVDQMLYLYRVRDRWENATFKCNQSIQDHLALAREHYAQQFEEINRKRLGDSQREPAPLGSVLSRKLSVIVPVASPSEATSRCLQSIRSHASEAEIVVVANGCSLSAIGGPFDRMVELEVNLGFAAGCNAGAQVATGDALCFLNDDAEFVDSATPELLTAKAREGFLAGPYSNAAKPPQGDVPKAPLETDVEVDALSGFCLAVQASLFRALDGFDPRFNTWEDDDLCRRAYRTHPSVVVGGTWVRHQRHATFDALGKDVQAIMRDNGELFRRKHPKIRVVVIAKDEAAAIEGFIRHLRPYPVYVLDTGSTDGTQKLARDLGAVVEEWPWVDDFAAARNEALRRFRGDADWVIMLDPDERLSGEARDAIAQLVFQTRVDVFHAPLHAKYPDGTMREFVPKPFLFRADPDLRWVFRVHEKLIGSQRQALVQNGAITHLLEYHEDGRRERAAATYSKLEQEEPYFADPDARERWRRDWPILDYDRPRLPERIFGVVVGPLVSVIIPTFRRPELLEKAIRSVLGQTWWNLEVIVVQDGDVSPVVEDERVRSLQLPKNHGAGGAVPRNYGIRAAAGSFIAYLDDDNTWEPEHVAMVMESIELASASFGFSSMKVGDKRLVFERPEQFQIDTSCVIHRRRLIDKYGWWKTREEAGYAHDWELFSRWVEGDEWWAATGEPTVNYNAETSGQKEFLTGREDASRTEVVREP